MAKKLFNLPGYYEGLKGRRIKQSGRLVMYKVINDPPPYWFVIIKNFDLEKDKASGAKSIGSWRFQDEADALAKFEELLPLYPETKRDYSHLKKFGFKKREPNSPEIDSNG